MRLFNINNYIKVKLTPEGLSKLSLNERSEMDGEYHKFQLWKFMQLFGTECYMGNPNQYFENNSIIIPDAAESIEASPYKHMIGRRVNKPKSGKPFKSTLQVNTVKGITVNPNIGRIAFTFEEDDSIVNCETCELVN